MKFNGIIVVAADSEREKIQTGHKTPAKQTQWWRQPEQAIIRIMNMILNLTGSQNQDWISSEAFEDLVKCFAATLWTSYKPSHVVKDEERWQFWLNISKVDVSCLV